MVQLKGSVDENQYVNVSEREILPWVANFHGESLLFQHENAASHAVRHVRKFLCDKIFDVLEWLARSPDLNKI